MATIYSLETDLKAALAARDAAVRERDAALAELSDLRAVMAEMEREREDIALIRENARVDVEVTREELARCRSMLDHVARGMLSILPVDTEGGAR